MMFHPSKVNYYFKDFIGFYENAFTKKECEDVIKHFEKCHDAGYTYPRRFQTITDDTSLTIDPPYTELDWTDEFIHPFNERFKNIFYALYNIEYPSLQNARQHGSIHLKLQKTRPTQGYHQWHHENDGIFHQDRLLAWMIYLNDVEEGGETEFLYQSIRVAPKAGTLLIWPAGFTHTHRGNPPLSGDKYIATGWVQYYTSDQSQGASEMPNVGSKDTKKMYV